MSWLVHPLVAIVLLTACGSDSTPATTTTTTAATVGSASGIGDLMLSWCALGYSEAQARDAAAAAVQDGTLAADKVDLALGQYASMTAATDQC